MSELFVNYWLQLLVVAALCYLFGGINFAILFSKLIKHKDIRSVGSGNAGTTNVFRVFGLRMGALTFLCDSLKGAAACLLCKFIFAHSEWCVAFQYWAGLFVVLGHIFPIYYKFRGGKGVASCIGICFVLQPLLMLCCVVPMCLVILVFDRMSVMSLLFAAFMIVWHWVVLRGQVGVTACVVLTCMFSAVFFAHRHNVLRILAGKELKTGVRRKVFRLDKREAHAKNINEQSALQRNAEEIK